MKKIYGYLYFLLIILFLSFISICIVYFKNSNEIIFNKSESFFMDFEIIEDKVYTYCELSIYNGYNENKEVKITAYDNTNVKFGLIKYPELDGYDKNSGEPIFNLNKGKNIISVKFEGSFAGNNQRANRLLPDKILIQLVNVS